VMETTHAPAEKPAAKASAPAPTQTAAAPAARTVAPAAPKPAASKAGTNPDRTLNKRYTYAGVTDTGPVPGETFEQKVARLKAVSAGAKQRAEESGGTVATAAAEGSIPDVAMLDQTASPQATVPAGQPAAASSALPSQKPTGDADRSLMIRSTYCGVVDTGPVPGETFAQKVARLTALSAAVKQRSESG
jgi:hypothetical protein